MKHICKRCLYTTDVKSNLRSHLSRSNECNVNENGGQDIDRGTLLSDLGTVVTRSKDHQCPFCKNKYSCAPSLYRHKKTCKAKHSNVQNDQIQSSLKDAIEDVLKRFGVSSIASLIQTPSTQMVNNGNQTVNNGNVTNNIQINLNAHGNEDISYLTHQFLTQCTKEAYFDGIPELIREVHLNPEHPENRNIRGKSIRQNTMETYNGKKWVRTAAVPVLDSLIQKGCKVFWKHYMDNLDGEFRDVTLQSIVHKNLLTLTNVTKDRKTETYYKIRNKVFFMFFEDVADEFAVVMEPKDQENLVEDTLNNAIAT